MYKILFRMFGKLRKYVGGVVDNGENGDHCPIGLHVREVLACDHVGINYLVLDGTRNFFIQKSGYIVFEENVCKVVCPACLMMGRPTVLV